jgi:lysine-specific demethylase/histidyl-hydroxylase NO66
VTSPGSPVGALGRFIAITPRRFADEYWGKRPLLTPAAQLRAGFGDLIDAPAVDELVSRRGLRTPFLRMAKDGDLLPPQRYTRGGGAGAGAADQAADDRVLEQIATGATLVLQGLHRTWPPLVTFTSALAAELGHPVQVNAYITPPQSQGFAAHYDVHDVFVVQIAGRKTWRIHEPVLVDPLGDQPWERRRDAVAARAAEPPLIDTVLQTGDVLYLPRGYLHSATALDGLSIHLTVGIHAISRYQLVRHLLTAAQDDPALRASLPMGVDLSDPAVLAPQLRATLDALRRHLDDVEADEVADLIGTDLMRQTRPAPIAPLAQLAVTESVDLAMVLRLRPGLRLRVRAGETSLRLQLVDKTVELAPGAEQAVKAIVSGAEFTPGELPGLDATEQLATARQLLREGVVVPA